jgi:LPXTG-motif cell wall-anchored protein
MLCSFPLPTTWTSSVQYEGVTCTLPGVTCPTATSGRAAKDGAFVEAVIFSGVASVAATTTVTLTTFGPLTNPTTGQVFPGPQFVYNGAAGVQPDTVTFTIDRAANIQSLLSLGGTATMSVYLDDLTAGTSLTVVNGRPIADSSAFVTDPTVSVDPTQLTMGHTYNARVVTSFSQPVGVLPNTIVYYRNFNLTATGQVPVVDTSMISPEALSWIGLGALLVVGGFVAIRRRRVIS